MAQDRVMGYVVGSDTVQGRTVWKVRCKQGDKYEVASVHGGIALAPGLNVSFLLGSAEDTSGQAVRRAVDVRLYDPSQAERKSAAIEYHPEWISICVEKVSDGTHSVYTTGATTEQEAQGFMDEDNEVSSFLHFTEEMLKETPLSDSEQILAGFRVISSLTAVDGTRDALEQLLQQAYELGRKARYQHS